MLEGLFVILISVSTLVYSLDLSRYTPNENVNEEVMLITKNETEDIGVIDAIAGYNKNLFVLGVNDYTTENPYVIDPDRAKRELKTWIVKLDCHKFPIELINCLMVKRVLLKNVLTNPDVNSMIKSPMGYTFVAKLQETDIVAGIQKFVQLANITLPSAQ